MDIRKVKKLIELVEESDIDELEIREAEESVRICRRRPAPAHIELSPAPATPTAPAVAATQVQESSAAVHDGEVVTAPMVGTFYQASSPGAKPFVTVGHRVESGDTLCIIEAMKILNQIEAERSGILRAVLAEDGQPVEFGQPLFVIDPD
jgi:acetyl-CoA carboxylase biotin carboxyl carrier protein